MQLCILITVLILGLPVILSKWRPSNWGSPRMPMVWIDGRYRKTTEVDTFYDRVVSIYYYSEANPQRYFSHEATGVLITDQLALTSFNAFRTLGEQSATLKDMDLYILYGRYMYEGPRVLYIAINDGIKLVCGRQVIIPFGNMSEPSHMLHGQHSPIHDLMVIRLNKKNVFINPQPTRLYNLDEYKSWKYVESRNAYLKNDVGPIQTELARPEDRIGENLEFVSIGHINDRHIKENRYLELEKFDAQDKVVTDCDEWIPKEWGYFICLRNINNYAGIAAGALLFSDDKLFGVGAFALWKGPKGVLVFTDVRPYWRLLYRTCTESDQQIIIKDDL